MKTLKPLYTIIVFITFLSCNDTKENSNLNEIAKLSKELKEISGITYYDNSYWAICDSGNKNRIYKLNESGKIEQFVTIKDLENNDWEDITKDENGNLYIGDFGNNDNDRKDLGIYKIDANSLNNSEVVSVQSTTFYYPEQKDFPPKKRELFYDCEGFFELDGFFYLFTKNRSKGFDGTTLLYKIPNKAGHFKAELVTKYQTCANFNFCAITSASISPNKETIALLGHDKIWLIKNNKGVFSPETKTYNLNHYSQKESLCFKNDETIIIADEKIKKNGGKLYEISLLKIKA